MQTLRILYHDYTNKAMVNLYSKLREGKVTEDALDTEEVWYEEILGELEAQMGDSPFIGQMRDYFTLRLDQRFEKEPLSQTSN